MSSRQQPARPRYLVRVADTRLNIQKSDVNAEPRRDGTTSLDQQLSG